RGRAASTRPRRTHEWFALSVAGLHSARTPSHLHDLVKFALRHTVIKKGQVRTDHSTRAAGKNHAGGRDEKSHQRSWKLRKPAYSRATECSPRRVCEPWERTDGEGARVLAGDRV